MLGRSALFATVRGLLCGVCGGAGAGLLDAVMSSQRAAQFLPDGSLRLVVFLAALYAAFAGVGGALFGLLAFLVGRATDLGPLWTDAFSISGSGSGSGSGATPPAHGAARPGSSRIAFGLGLLVGSIGLGVALRQLTLIALLRFHSPMLIAAFVGGVSAALGLLLPVAAFLVAALVNLALPARMPLGRMSQRVPVPAGLLAMGWMMGLAMSGAGVARLLAALQQQHRMTAALRALNTALWSPPIVLLGLALGHLAVWHFGPRRPAESAMNFAARALRFASRPIGAILLFSSLLLIGAGTVAVLWWPIVKLLPLVPAMVVSSCVLVALLCAQLPTRILSPRLPVLCSCLLLPPLTLVVALQAGRADRVRKAAVLHASLAAPLLDGLHAAWDMDHDGYSPLLGADCNDFNPDVHPGAFDWPDDGIDQNCNGHQATLTRTPRPPFSSLPDSVPRTPNILLISIDALRADHVGAYGYPRPTTPRIDELARESVLFQNGWAHSPSTRYSVPAILTGRYESTIAWGSPSVHWPPQVLPENRLMSEMLKEHGYHTGALVPAHYFEPTWGLDQGFDVYDNSLAHLHGNISGDPARATGSSSRELGDLGVRFVENAAKQQAPFFLWMHFYDPHYLYERHPEVPSFGDRDIDLYDGEVRYTDLHVGRVLDAVRAAGAWNNTVVIITADHGEGFGEHGVFQHGYQIYAQQDKVPFIVRVPGIAPRKVAEPVGHVDLFPSLLNILRAPDEPQLLGRSFLDLMQGGSDPRLVFEEVDYEGPTARKAVASRTAQLIANVVPDGTFEFYDLASDPAEEHDRFVRGAGGQQGRLVEALGAWEDEIALPVNFKERVEGNLSSLPIASEQALGAEIGGWLVVDGVSVPKKIVRRGDEVEVSLVMHARTAPPPGWRLFTHATSSTGAFVNLDHEPVEGFVPLARLRPGQWVRDRIRFKVPPNFVGPITVEMGLWKSPHRAHVVGPRMENGIGVDGDSVRAATIAVDVSPHSTAAPTPSTPESGRPGTR